MLADKCTYMILVLVVLLGGTGNMAWADSVSDLAQGNDAFNRGDLTTAMTWYRQAAEAGSVEAQIRLAYILDLAEENAEAYKWYRAAAESGNAAAQEGLAGMYAKGEGTEQDFAAAVRWFTRAARQGHTSAISILAAAYQEGTLGLAVDPDRAAYWQEALIEARRKAESPGGEEG